jgi:DNA-binding PadR family transcriptional regulator
VRTTVKLPFDRAILGALMKRPMHGYDIHRFLSSALKGVWYVGMSNMYGMLKKLESDGYVRATIETTGNRPAKRVFLISDKGKGSFEEWISKPVSNIRDMRIEFITKLFFFKELGISGARELVEKQKTVCQGILETLGSPTPESSDFERLLFDFRGCQIRSIMSWLEVCSGFLETTSGVNRKE